MRKILVYALLFIANLATAQTVSVTVNDVKIEAGKTADLVVSLANSMDIAGWQMTLYLPEGATLPYEEEDGEKYYDETVKLSSRHLRSHICSVTETTDGGWLIMAYNPNKPTAIKEHSDEIVTITLKAADTFEGEQAGTIKGIAVADMQSTQTDVEGNVTFKVTKTSSDGIRVLQSNTSDDSVYDMSGKPIATPGKGLYIQGGQKYVKK